MEAFLSTVLGMLALIFGAVMMMLFVSAYFAGRYLEKKRLATMRRAYCCLRAANDKWLRQHQLHKSLK